MLLIIAILIALFGVLFYASYSISSKVYLKSLCYNRASKDAIAITFDDGVDEIMTPRVLDVLKRHNAKATFFVIGEKVLCYPEIVKRIVCEGHLIANHSYSHKWNFPLKSTANICSEIEQCNIAIESVVGFRTDLFRPPFGVTNPMVGCAVRRSKMRSIGWSIRSFDTMAHTVDRVEKRVVKQISAGKVILLHDNRENADALLDRILCHIERRGLRAVTVKELFNI